MRDLTRFLSVRPRIDFASKQVLWSRLIIYKKLDSILVFHHFLCMCTTPGFGYFQISRLCYLVWSMLYLAYSHLSIVSVCVRAVLKTFDSIITFIILWFPFMFLYISLLPFIFLCLPFIFLCYLSYFFVSLPYFFYISLIP